jgi:hypothetical protein
LCAVANTHGDVQTLAATPGMFSYRTPLQVSFASVRDGQSSTLMLGEVLGELNIYLSQLSVISAAFITGNRLNSRLIGNPSQSGQFGSSGLPIFKRHLPS